MNKKKLSERDICRMFITPAIENSGWDKLKQIREEKTFTNGKIIVRGNKVIRGEKKRADYILSYKEGIPLAIIEAKDNKHNIGSGLQQALEYGEILDIPFIYSSNGDGFIEHDRTGKSKTVERELSLKQFPSPKDLWERYKKWKNIVEEQEKIVSQDYYIGRKKKPRYYQSIAINRTVEAIAKGKKRILLTMATGTGKTYVASQIMWRLWKSRKVKRILYLADRNILLTQAMNGDLKPFKKVITNVKHRKIDKSYEVYMALYQSVTGNEEWKNIYKKFSKDFFDLVIVDECHRGSASADSAWREVLEYFSGAAQIGMTATPKETKDVSNIDYFGDPIYIYSLKQGIEDGFLAPYKVIKVSIDRDVEGYRPTRGKKDKYGHEIPDKVYDQKDYDKKIVIDDRTKIVAKKITEFLKNTNRYDKTIVFCIDIEHAERMRRALVNENKDLVNKNSKYVWRITGDDEVCKGELDNFIDPASKYPVIVTTSKLLNTGVDAQTCKLIVLESNIQSMTEFKQIIGRGTRIKEEYKKYYFNIIDFRKVTNLFADPDFDGEPVQIYEPKPDEPVAPPKIEGEDGGEEEEEDKPKKYYVDDVYVSVVNERVQYLGDDGKLITESLKDYTRASITKDYRSLDNFLKKWNKSKRKTAVIKELLNHGIFLHHLKEEIGDYDPFDLICHVAFDKKPLTRDQRAKKVIKGDYFKKYGDKARAVINELVKKYSDEGIESIEDIKVLSVNPFNKFGTPIEIVKSFGGKDKYFEAIHELENKIYFGDDKLGHFN